MECSPFRRGDPWENRTPVCGVRGRRLDRLTNGPHLTASSLYRLISRLSTCFLNFFDFFRFCFFTLLYYIISRPVSEQRCLFLLQFTPQHSYCSTNPLSFSMQQLYKQHIISISTLSIYSSLFLWYIIDTPRNTNQGRETQGNLLRIAGRAARGKKGEQDHHGN